MPSGRQFDPSSTLSAELEANLLQQKIRLKLSRVVTADVPTVRLPIGNIFPQAFATVEVFRIRIILETRDLERRISFVIVSTQVPH